MWYEPLIVALVVVLVVLVLIGPLRSGRVELVQQREAGELADLEAAKEAKYREIRDAEMDLRTGKLSAEDHRALDRGLRAEAIELLRRIDRLSPSGDVSAGPRADAEDADAPAEGSPSGDSRDAVR